VSSFRDRVVDFRRVKAAELLADPRDYRRHPPEQRSYLAAVLEEIGFAMDIDPAYCDVAVVRWERLTGSKAVREPA
jgi:hypothetical protein